MVIFLGVLLIAIGLFICFRGICIASIFKAVFGAIQGLVYAFAVQLILQLLQIVTGNWLFFLCVCIAVIFAYLAAKREELYQRIQGIINALIIGALIAVIVYGLIYYSAFMNNRSEGMATLAIVVAIAIVAAFAAMGAKWYKFFRRVGTFVIVLAITAIILSMYMAFWPAILLSLVIDAIVMYCLSTYEKYIEFLKIAAVGACVAMVGIWMLLDGTYMVMAMTNTLSRSISRLISGRTASTSYSTEMVLSSIGIAVMTVWGAVVQRRYYDSHLDENGAFHVDLSGILGKSSEIADKATDAAAEKAHNIGTRIQKTTRSIEKTFRRNKKKIKKACLGVIIAVLVVAAGFGCVKLVQNVTSSLKKKAQVSTVSTFADRQMEDLHRIYPSAAFSLEGVLPLEVATDGDQPGYTIAFSGTIEGTMYVTGWYSDGAWYTDMVNIWINNPYDGIIEEAANLYGATLAVFYGVDSGTASSRIQQEMTNNPYWKGTELTFGAANNTYIWIGDTGYGEWTAECGEKF